MSINKFNLPFACILFIFSLGCQDSPRTKENAENISKIKVGMKISDVKQIMGEPDKIEIYPFDDEEFQFIYTSPSGYSGEFQIAISRRDSSILRVYDGL